MNRWFVNNLAVVNLILIVFSIISYMATMNSLVNSTHWGGQIGEIGGVLEYHPFGQSFVYHVTKENLRGQLLFSFLDVTSYLLAALIFFSVVALFIRDLKETEPCGYEVRKLAIRNLAFGVLCIFLYVWGTMMFIEQQLNYYQPQIGGVVSYFLFLAIAVTHVNRGNIEGSLLCRTGDFTLWLLLALLISTVIAIRRQLKSSTQNKQV